MAIRARATAMEEAIINAKDTAAIAALFFVSSDGDRNKERLVVRLARVQRKMSKWSVSPEFQT